MNEDAPTLQVAFAIDFLDSFGQLKTLDELIGKTTADAVREFQRLESASKGALSLGSATAQITAYANASTRESATIARTKAQTEKAGEALVRQLDREAAAFGKTRDEMRSAKAEALAFAATQQGNTDLAQRITAAESALYDKQFAAARQARMEAEALAEAKATAAQQAVAAAEREAQAIRLAAGAHQQFEAAARSGMVAYREQQAAQAAAAAETEELSRAAGRLRSSIDPAYVSQQRFDREMREAQRLVSANAITLDEYVAKLRMERGVLDATSAAHARGASSAGAHRAAMQGLSFQAQDTFTQISMGANPLSVLAIQGGQAAGQMVALEGAAGSVARFMIGPWGLAFTAGLLVVGALSDKLFGSAKAANAKEGAAKSLTDAINDLNDATGRQIRSEQQVQEETLRSAAALRQRALDTRTATIEALKLAQAELAASMVRSSGPGQRGELGTIAAMEDSNRLSGLQALLAKNQADLNRAEVTFRQAQVPIMQRFVTQAIDPAAAATGRYQRALDKLNAGYAAGRVPSALYQSQLAQITRTRDADIAAAQRHDRSTRGSATVHREAASAALNQAKAERELLAALSVTPATIFNPVEAIEQRRRAIEDSRRAFSTLFNGEDPLGDALRTDETARADRWQAKWSADAEQQEALQAQLRLTSDLADSAGKAMARSFGRAGEAVSEAMRALSHYGEERQRIAEQSRSEGERVVRTAALQISTYGDMAAAAKGFFSEGSAGYKALAAAEKVYRVAQFAMSLQAMVQNAAETLGFVTNAAARATADGTAGIAAQSKLPFPFNIAAMAATAAALVAAGIAVFGGGGGSAKSAPVTNTGTGTVLGDSSAKSDSIKNAINALQEVDRLMLTSSREMATSLRSIDQQIGGLASVLVRSGNISADSSVAQGFKPDVIGSVLSKIPLIGGVLGSLFGSTSTVKGSGLYAGGQSVGSIIGGGFNAQTYSDVEKVKKFLGLTTSRKTSTVYGGAVDASVSDQFALILRSFNDAIVAAAGPLGASTSEIAAKVSGFVFTLGKVDLSGLTGTEIQEKLEAVFGAAADSMAAGAFPGIERFQKVGEGAFETLVRVSSTVETVTAALDQLGASTAALGIDAKVGLADQFDSLSALTSAVGAYFEAFYTPAEQAAAKAVQLGAVFGGLGLAMPATLVSFRQLVEAQDLTTAAGQATYATLLQLAPAFAEMKASMDGAKSAADILSERQDLQRQLLDLQGDTAALRALDLAKLDASNRGLQEQVWAMQDAQKAAAAADQLRQAWTSSGDSITDEVKRIRGLTTAGTGGGFAALQGQFNAATAAARAGDQDAAKSLPGLSQALLTAAAQVAASRQELARVQAATASSLEQTRSVIDLLGASAAAPATNAAALAAAAAASQAASAPTAANDDMGAELRLLRAEVAEMRADNNAGHATTAGNTGKMARKLDDVTAQSGGDAIAVTQAA